LLQSYFVFARSIVIRTSATLNRIIVDLLSPLRQFIGIILHLKLSTDRFLSGNLQSSCAKRIKLTLHNLRYELQP
jgi:hypothetical protein